MNQNKNSYRQIMKATSLFGGVQVINIIIQIIRSKAIAILLGPAGIGLLGLFNTTILVIGNLTNFGLGISGVKDISQANNTENKVEISKITTIIRRLVWFTGVLGSLILLISSTWLSKFVFNTNEYRYGFMWLSISLLFNQLSSGQLVILQGMRKLKFLAKANILGNAIGLIVSLPFYYYLGTKGIVPAIIATAIATLFFSLYYSNKIEIKTFEISMKETYFEGKNMLKMGFTISISGLLTVGGFYLVQIFVRNIGGVEEVGLYVAGFAIINNYVGLIFNAMATDYYPRLSAIANDNTLCTDTVNQQAEIGTLILAPILLLFLIFINWGIILLYSEQFLGIKEMIYWAALGVMFKATSWSMAFIFLAKGASKLFFWNEVMVNIYMLIFNFAGYYYFGLVGLGLAFTISYLLYMIQVFLIVKSKFHFSFNKDFLTVFGIQFVLVVLGFLCTYFIDSFYKYYLGIILITFSSYYSFKILNQKIDFIGLFKKFKK
jgi:O-antigen/teichoic acid export membrane protein